jgi:hypothetical protein
MEDAVGHDMAEPHDTVRCRCVRCQPLERLCGCQDCEEYAEATKGAKFKAGDRVIYTNDYGVNWGTKTIKELDTPDKWGHRYYITPTDAPWMYVREKNLELAPPEEQPGAQFGSW